MLKYVKHYFYWFLGSFCDPIRWAQSRWLGFLSADLGKAAALRRRVVPSHDMDMDMDRNWTKETQHFFVNQLMKCNDYTYLGF